VIYLPQGVRRGFSFYFDPPGKEIGIPVDPRRWSRADFEGPLRKAARSLTSTESRVWVIFSSPLPEDAIGDLVAAIELRGYRKASVHDFQGVGVALLVRPRP
jgi:hypothetical protein